MNSFTWFFFILLTASLAITGPHIYRYVNVMGYHRFSTTNKHPGLCSQISGTENGSEDIELLPGGKLLISTGFTFMGSGDEGSILIADLEEDPVRATPLPIIRSLPLFLNPLGVEKWIAPDSGEITIFVTSFNTSTGGALVEVFRLSEDYSQLTHLETIGRGDPNVIFVNSVAAVGERQFYYTNVYGTDSHWERTYHLPWGTVGFYDGTDTKIVASGIAGPNGIGISPDHRFVYVNCYFDRMVRIFARSDDNSLTITQDYVVDTAPDNLMVDDDGYIWTSGHPLTWKIFKSFDDKSYPVPMKVLRLGVDEGRVTSFDTVFVDDGRVHSGGSVAVTYKDKLVLGAVIREAHICQINTA